MSSCASLSWMNSGRLSSHAMSSCELIFQKPLNSEVRSLISHLLREHVSLDVLGREVPVVVEAALSDSYALGRLGEGADGRLGGGSPVLGVMRVHT